MSLALTSFAKLSTKAASFSGPSPFSGAETLMEYVAGAGIKTEHSKSLTYAMVLWVNHESLGRYFDPSLVSNHGVLISVLMFPPRVLNVADFASANLQCFISRSQWH